MLNDDVGPWVLARAAASKEGNRALVLIGSSRIQVGINTSVFAREVGVAPIQLAIDGYSGLGVLNHLAGDDSFNGTVICELGEKYLQVIAQQQSEPVPEQWIKAYDQRTIFSDFEWRTRSLWQRTFAFRLPDLALRNLFTSLRFRQMPRLPYLRMEPDRSKRADYSLADVEVRRQHHETAIETEFNQSPPLSVPVFLQTGSKLNGMTGSIEARGGKVIFVRFPTSGKILEMEEARYPKTQYWDELSKEVKATMIHFKDYPELADFKCPDGTHLDYRDTGPFTTALVGIIEREKKGL